MKKIILFITFFCLSFNLSYADDRLDKPYNVGYAKRYGMVGIYGHLSDYIKDEWDNELSPGGGGFIYYNVFNNFWGNVSIGINADYVGGEFITKNKIKAKAYMAPLSLNLAYMTSSNVVNAWAGIGFSYNFANFNVKEAYFNNTKYGLDTSIKNQLIGVDAFVGLEYIFTNDGRWGAFFEFRYTYSEMPELKVDIPNIGSVSDKLDTQRFKYTVGFTYHF